MKNNFKLMLVLMVLVIVVGAVLVAGETKSPYVVGAFVSATGPNSTLGTPEKETLEMLSDKINKSGGINGHPLKLIIEDDGTDNTSAVKIANKLINQDKVCALIGSSGTGPSLAVMPIAEANGIPQIAMAAGTKITDPINKWVFRTAPLDSFVVGKIYDYLNRQKIERVGIICDSSGYGTSGRDQLKALAPKYKIKIVAEESFGIKDTDMTVQLTKIRTTNAQAIICWGTNPGPAIIAKNRQQLGITLPLFMSHGIANQAFLDQAGSAANGIILPAIRLIVADLLPASDSQKKLLLEYAKDFKNSYHKPADHYGGHAYDALSLIVKALKKAGDNPAKIRDEIEKTKNFPGIGGIFNYSAENHDGLDSNSCVMLKIVKQKWTILK